jgi:hypothetical protein
VNTLAEFGTGEFLWTLLWFTLFFIWIWIVVMCFIDIVNDDSLGGWGKAGWIVFIIVLPYLAVFIYLIARGAGMQARQVSASQATIDAQRAYLQSVAAPASSVSEELARLAELHEKGALTDAEFQALKAKAMT